MDPELLKEILNRLHQAIEIHPYLSGLMTREYQRYLCTLSEALRIVWEPGEQHPDWEINGSELIKLDEEESE